MNKEEFDFLGITKWHELGIKGQGIIIASREGMTKHGTRVYNILKQVCPEAEIKIKCDYTKDDDFDIYTTSLFFGSDKNKAERSQKLIEKNKILICAAGNENAKSSSVLSKLEQWLSIGACHLTNGKAKIANYSSKFDGLDFMSFSHLKVENEKSRINGTSFSAPLFAGMCALVQCYFLQKENRKLTYNEMIEYIKNNCLDLNEKGRDDNSGYGIFVLPELEKEKMFKDYTEWEQAIDFLAEKKRMDSPDLWKERIKKDNDINLMWFCVKWANDANKI